jgi:uncharacterized membrane protein
VLAIIVAAAAFGLSMLTSEGDNGQGWTDGSQGISNASWILMILSIAFAVVALVVGVVRGARTRD